jgi:bacterioferritin
MTTDARQQLLDGLNIDLAGEFQTVIMYRLCASMVQGPYRQELRVFFAGEIPEELRHAQILADKIAELDTIERYVQRRAPRDGPFGALSSS